MGRDFAGHSLGKQYREGTSHPEEKIAARRSLPRDASAVLLMKSHRKNASARKQKPSDVIASWPERNCSAKGCFLPAKR